MGGSNLAAGLRRSSSEPLRAAMGEAWRLEFGDEKGEISLARCVLEGREEIGRILMRIIII